MITSSSRSTIITRAEISIVAVRGTNWRIRASVNVIAIIVSARVAVVAINGGVRATGRGTTGVGGTCVVVVT